MSRRKLRVVGCSRGLGMYRGGGETNALQLSRYLSKLEVQVHFVVGAPLAGRVRYPITDLPTTYCRSPYLRDLSQFLHNRLRRISGRLYRLDGELYIESCYRTLRGLLPSCDLIQAFETRSLEAAIRVKADSGVRVVARLPGPPHKSQYHIIQAADAVVASGDTVHILREDFDRQDVVNIPPGVDTELFRPVSSQVKSEYGIEENELILFVGRFVPLKNLPFLLRAFEQLLRRRNNVKMMMIGEGPLESEVRLIAQHLSLGKHLLLPGRIPNRLLAPYYCAADVFVLSSLYESFSVATLEAMSCGRPVVVTDVGYLPHLIRHGENGLVVGSNDVGQMVDALETLLDDKDLAFEMGQRNHHTIEQSYNWSNSAGKLRVVYDSLFSSVDSGSFVPFGS